MIAAGKGYIEVATLLLDYGARIDARDNEGKTALVFATWFGRSDMVKLLLKNNAYTNALNVKGSTALMFSVKKYNLDIFKLLLESGADIEVENKEGRTVLSLATSRGQNEIITLIEAQKNMKELALSSDETDESILSSQSEDSEHYTIISDESMTNLLGNAQVQNVLTDNPSKRKNEFEDHHHQSSSSLSLMPQTKQLKTLQITSGREEFESSEKYKVSAAPPISLISEEYKSETIFIESDFVKIPEGASNKEILEILRTREYIKLSKFAKILNKAPEQWTDSEIRQLKFLTHPDKTGNKEDFLAITKFLEKSQQEDTNYGKYMEHMVTYAKGIDIAVDIAKISIKPDMKNIVTLVHDGALLASKALPANFLYLPSLLNSISITYEIYNHKFYDAGIKAVQSTSYYLLNTQIISPKYGIPGFAMLNGLLITHELINGEYGTAAMHGISATLMSIAPATTSTMFGIYYTVTNLKSLYDLYIEQQNSCLPEENIHATNSTETAGNILTHEEHIS